MTGAAACGGTGVVTVLVGAAGREDALVDGAAAGVCGGGAAVPHASTSSAPEAPMKFFMTR